MCVKSTLFFYLLLYSSIVTRKNIVGIRIKATRKEAKVSQMKLAAEMKLLGIRIDRSTIAKLEIGEYFEIVLNFFIYKSRNSVRLP